MPAERVKRWWMKEQEMIRVEGRGVSLYYDGGSMGWERKKEARRAGQRRDEICRYLRLCPVC